MLFTRPQVTLSTRVTSHAAPSAPTCAAHGEKFDVQGDVFCRKKLPLPSAPQKSGSNEKLLNALTPVTVSPPVLLTMSLHVTMLAPPALAAAMAPPPVEPQIRFCHSWALESGPSR